jgi:hypothetical protein
MLTAYCGMGKARTRANLPDDRSASCRKRGSERIPLVAVCVAMPSQPAEQKSGEEPAKKPGEEPAKKSDEEPAKQ